jgi:hypothetical protein
MFWIHADDLRGQSVIDEVELHGRIAYVKVSDPKGAIVYHEEPSPKRAAHENTCHVCRDVQSDAAMRVH